MFSFSDFAISIVPVLVFFSRCHDFILISSVFLSGVSGQHLQVVFNNTPLLRRSI